jgi:hypothetical protein
MSTVMTKQVIALAFVGSFSVAGGMAAGQQPPRPPRPPRPVPAPAPEAPSAPFPFNVPLPPLPAVPPLPPLPPLPPVDFPSFDFVNPDFNFVNPDFDIHIDPLDIHIDVDAIRESARRAAESARDAVASLDFSALGADIAAQVEAFQRGEGRGGRGGRGSDGQRQSEAQADALYNQAQASIDTGRYDRALEQLNRLASMAGNTRVDAALYWKSYALAKQGQRAEALAALADLQKRFADSRWLKDAKALEVEVRQASGQAVSPDAQNDEEIKLLALRGIMQSDPDRALPMIERMLAGNSSVKLRENALFVLSQSRSAKAKEIIAGVARTGNPDLQLRAVRYLGAMGGPENRQLLDEIYRGTTDTALKRQILRSLNNATDRTRLLSIAKTETSAELRSQAIQQLGVIHADAELWDAYQSESSADLKRAILQALHVSGNADRLLEIARTDKDPQLRRTAIRNLGSMSSIKTETLKSLYTADAPYEIKREIHNALMAQRNAAALVELARAEKDPAMKREIVSKLSSMSSKEATDYLLELLK